eukprot:1161058-Pelagomonas_calceolata.AAC.1
MVCTGPQEEKLRFHFTDPAILQSSLPKRVPALSSLRCYMKHDRCHTGSAFANARCVSQHQQGDLPTELASVLAFT